VAENGNPTIEILLSDETTGVAGKVIDDAAKTSNYLVMVSRLSTHGPVIGIVSPPDFQISGLAPGEYEISAYRAGTNGARAPLLNASCAESQKVTVVEGPVKYITLRPCVTQ